MTLTVLLELAFPYIGCYDVPVTFTIQLQGKLLLKPQSSGSGGLPPAKTILGNVHCVWKTHSRQDNPGWTLNAAAHIAAILTQDRRG